MRLLKKCQHSLFAFLLLGLSATTLHAQALTVTISGTEKVFPIAVGTFGGSTPNIEISDVIRNNLATSGFFKIIDSGPSVIDDMSLDFQQWKAKATNLLVVGNVLSSANPLKVRFRLMDIARETQLSGSTLEGNGSSRGLAHTISDQVFEGATGIPGAFATKLAMVVKRGSSYELVVSDSDGANAKSIIRSQEPIISPAWSPNGRTIAYVSFETGKPVIYAHEVATGARKAIANFKGNNSAPSWSPDGSKLAIVLSQSGGSQMYLIQADGSQLQRLLVSNSIDTEPVFSPNGQDVYFTSDRGGSPQIYRLTIGSASVPQRVTFLENSQNTSPVISPDGKTLAFVTRGANGFRIATLDLASNQYHILSPGPADLSPSFAPNGQHILFTASQGGKGNLMRTSLQGNGIFPLTPSKGDVQQPVWGPMSTKNLLP